MEELISIIAKGLVEDKDAVTVTVGPATEDRTVVYHRAEDRTVVYHLHVGPQDMGRVIGKQGRIAKAIRTIVRASAGQTGEKSIVEID